jgi:hypothetical protein
VNQIWAWSASLNALCIVASILFMVRLTHGAGFRCRAAFVRLLHRLALSALIVTMAKCALLQVATRQGPSPEWFYFQIAFTFTMFVGLGRMLQAPTEIPGDATWKRRASLRYFIEN